MARRCDGHITKRAKPAIHMVSAFAARQRHVLDQVKVADKANEIVAIPRLLDLLAIEKDSLQLRRKVAAWDDDFLVSLLAG